MLCTLTFALCRIPSLSSLVRNWKELLQIVRKTCNELMLKGVAYEGKHMYNLHVYSYKTTTIEENVYVIMTSS